MKDNKKVIVIVGLLILVLLICLLGIRQCEKEDELLTDTPIVDTDDENNDDEEENIGDEETITEVVPTVNEETSKPTIQLNGSDLIYVEINSLYQDAGATAQDEKYGDLTEKIMIDNPVDVSKLGTYVITYTITNEDEETASVTRTVIVQDTTAPILTYQNDFEEGMIVNVDANRNASFHNHAVTATDNSKGNVTLEMIYYYKAQENDEYQLVDSMDLGKLGYYQVYYVAIDESGNRSDDTLVVEYLVADTKGPNITVSMNGTSYPMLNPSVTVSAVDDYTNVANFAYAWVTSLEEEPNWINVDNNTLLQLENNGDYYLLLKAVDDLGNESTFTSNLFQKDDTLMQVTNFNLHSDQTYSGVNAGIKINQLESITDIASVVVKLYSNDTLLATNTSTDRIYDLALIDGSIELSTPFIVKDGTYVEEYWTTVQNSAYSVSMKPTKVVFEVTKSNGEVHTITNDHLIEPNVFWEGNFYDYDILVGPNYGNYTNLVEAINNAQDQSSILVLPGVYDGILAINKNLTIYGLDKENTIITTTTAPVMRTVPNQYGANPVIYVENGSLSLSNITVTSNISQYNAIDGITVNNGNLTLDQVIITNIKNSEGYNGMQYGRAITAYGTSNVNITNTHVNNFNKNGAHFVGTGVTANISNSTFIGSGINENAAAQNGVVYMDGASGSISNSVFSNFQYHDTQVAESYGILLYNTDAGNVQISNNNIFNNCDQNYSN